MSYIKPTLYIHFFLLLVFNLKAQDAGTTRGEFNVNPAGAATYNIPIGLPPGVKDIAPGISLQFNSQAGNGLAGWGWNIGGHSSISRVSANQFHDGFIDQVDYDINDRFALDGQRLVLKSGNYGRNNSVYVTGLHSNIKVVAFGANKFGAAAGPDYFMVYHPNGAIAKYENKLTDPNNVQPRHINEWVITYTQDPLGNMIWYYYYGSQPYERVRLRSIRYGGNIFQSGGSMNKIEFIWKDRIRPESSYAGGYYLFHRKKILSKINVYGYNDVLFRSYELTHRKTNLDYQLLTKIVERNGAGGALAPITITYNSETPNGIAQGNTLNLASNLNTNEYPISGDFDGDGKVDFFLFNNNTRNYFKTYQKKKNYQNMVNTAVPNFQNLGVVSFKNSANKLDPRQGVMTVKNTGSGNFNFRGYVLGSNSRFSTYFNRTWSDPGSSSSTKKHLVTGDFDGDGLSEGFLIKAGAKNVDLVEFKTTGAFVTANKGQLEDTYATNNSIFRVGDFDGNGKAELWHFLGSKVRIYGLNKNGQFRIINRLNEGELKLNRPLLMGDYNGDGKTDLLFPRLNSGTQWVCMYSRGNYADDHIGTYDNNGFRRNYRNFTNFTYQANNTNNEYHFVAQDFNGDGKADIIKHHVNVGSNRHTIQLFTNKGSNNFNVVRASSNNFTNLGATVAKGGFPIFLDINNSNGNLEYAFIHKNKINTYNLLKDHRKDTRVTKITNNQHIYTLTYAPMVPSAYYHPVTNKTYPWVNINYNPNTQLVVKVGHKAPGYIRAKYFRYREAVSHITGLGFMGFSQIKYTNWNGPGVKAIWNGKKFKTTHLGKLGETWQSFSASDTPSSYLKRTFYQYMTKWESGIKVFVNKPIRIEEIDYVSKVTTIDQLLNYDAYYNPTRVIEQIKPNGGSVFKTKDTKYTYNNNIGANNYTYKIGQIRKEEIGETTAGSAKITTINNYSYHSGRKQHLVKTIKTTINGANKPEEYFSYDAFGNVTYKRYQTGSTKRDEYFYYTTDGRFLRETLNQNRLRTKFYYNNVTGNPTKSIDHLNRVTENTYDNWQRAKTEKNYLGKITTYDYFRIASNGGVIKRITYPDGQWERQYYDQMDNLYLKRENTFDNKDLRVAYKYDLAGRKTQQSEPYYLGGSYKWNYVYYDDYGRVKEAKSYNGKRKLYTYNGLIKREVNDINTITSSYYADGSLKQVNDPGGILQYTYWSNGEIRNIKKDGTTVVNVFLDTQARKRSLWDVSAGTYQYQYNIFDQLTKEISPSGTETITYDGFGKIIKKTIVGTNTNNVENYSYNNTSKLLTSINATSNGESYQYLYQYDAYGRQKQIEERNAKARFRIKKTFDGLGRPLRDEYYSRLMSNNTNNLFTARYMYTLGKLTSIRDNSNNKALWTLVSENEKGQVTRANMGNGFIQTASYYSNGMLKQLRDYKGSSNALYMDYASWDVKKGQLKDRRNKVFGSYRETFLYDSMNRLRRVSGSQYVNHSYNAGGHIASNNKIGNYSYNSKNQVTSIALNAAGRDYYSNHYGNRDITYNADRKPASISVSGKGKVNFSFAPNLQRSHAYYGGTNSNINNRRFHKHYSTIMPAEILEDRNLGTNKFTFYLGGSEYNAPVAHIKIMQGTSVQKNEIHYVHRDYLGSILGITGATGTIIERRQFGAWGSVDRVSGHGGVMNHTSIIDRGYTGHEHFFEVKMIHMNGRMYDPVIGQFVSPDNYIQSATNTQSFNRYAYAMNNPLIYNDPDGEFFFLVPILAGVISSVGIGAVAATVISAAIIGGVSSVVINGVGNLLNGQPFFSGAGNAFALGAISGVLTFGIGEISNSLGFAGTTVAHGFVGGLTAELSGGDFIAGFAAAAVGHSIAHVTGHLTAKYGTDWRAGALQVASGALGGGIASKLAGGSFIMGFKQGLITSLLNQVAHNAAAGALLEDTIPGPQNRRRFTFRGRNNSRRMQNFTIEPDRVYYGPNGKPHTFIEIKSGSSFGRASQARGYAAAARAGIKVIIIGGPQLRVPQYLARTPGVSINRSTNYLRYMPPRGNNRRRGGTPSGGGTRPTIPRGGSTVRPSGGGGGGFNYNMNLYGGHQTLEMLIELH